MTDSSRLWSVRVSDGEADFVFTEHAPTAHDAVMQLGHKLGLGTHVDPPKVEQPKRHGWVTSGHARCPEPPAGCGRRTEQWNGRGEAVIHHAADCPVTP